MPKEKLYEKQKNNEQKEFHIEPAMRIHKRTLS